MTTPEHYHPDVRPLVQLVEQRRMLDLQIDEAIAECFRVNQTNAATSILGVSRATFYRRYGHLNPWRRWRLD